MPVGIVIIINIHQYNNTVPFQTVLNSFQMIIKINMRLQQTKLVYTVLLLLLQCLLVLLMMSLMV